MIAFIASILEYITSYVMEKLFNARWWDYSKRKSPGPADPDHTSAGNAGWSAGHGWEGREAAAFQNGNGHSLQA